MASKQTYGPSNYLIDETSKAKFLERPEYSTQGGMSIDQKIVIVQRIKFVVLKILALLRTPMKLTGLVVDFILNLLSANGGFFGLLLRFIVAKVEIPERGSETFLSTIGQLDGRINLYQGWEFIDTVSTGSHGIKPGSRSLMDLCVMASKLAYENAKVIQNVVNLQWKMNLVDVLDCWNDNQKRWSKQVFILTDKQKDANLILISFKGTDPFDADDWAIDFDFMWYPVYPSLGNLHMGFLEAMGLGNRDDTRTFDYHLLFEQASSFGDNYLEMAKGSAYYTILSILKRLLSEHENAQFVVTGHSLGGALAVLFPTVLVLKRELEIMKRLLGVYTFGQPRIADKVMGDFMKAYLSHPVDRYFRVVYCNDIVPRLPYDDKTFFYKHFGPCLYYNSFYDETIADDEPNPNGYGLRYHIFSHINAVWELVRGLMMGYTHGPDYEEGWFRIMFRLMGLLLPGVSGHCTTDYVNSVRLGPENNLPTSPL